MNSESVTGKAQIKKWVQKGVQRINDLFVLTGRSAEI